MLHIQKKKKKEEEDVVYWQMELPAMLRSKLMEKLIPEWGLVFSCRLIHVLGATIDPK